MVSGQSVGDTIKVAAKVNIKTASFLKNPGDSYE
jgi:hypothetical protein